MGYPMTEVHAHLDEPLEQASATLRAVAAEQGWSLAEGESGPDVLVFKKGVKATSWGAEIQVGLRSASPGVTKLEFETHETFAITDWGRGRRAIAKLLEAAGAEKD